MLRLPKFNGFRKNKDLDIIQRMKIRQFITITGVLLVVAFFGVAIATNMFNGGQKTKAATITMTNDQTISQLDTRDYSNDDIIIPNGVTAYIDGEHTFHSVTVQTGGTLKSHDYNRYGVYFSDTSRKLTSILNDSEDSRYVFIVRGLINTGSDHSRSYAPVNGESSNSTPSTFSPDDVASVEFFTPVSLAEGSAYNPSLWTTSIDYSFTNLWGANHHIFKDSQSSADNPLIPFEFRYYNYRGYHHFGFAACSGAADCSTIGNFIYLNTVAQSTNFTVNSPLAQVKTFKAWQSGDSSVVDTSVFTATTMQNYLNYKAVIDGYRRGSGYDSIFIEANYDIRTDAKVVREQGVAMALNSDIAQYESSFDTTNKIRPVFRFLRTTTDRSTPLAINNMDGDNFPILSSGVISANPEKIPTTINVPTGEFTVQADAKVNFNGKGFAPSGILWGSGPGGGRAVTSGGVNRKSGAGHSGTGGYTTNVYDSSVQADPVLPGSGSFRVGSSNSYHGYGGGMIKIIAKKIVLNPRSMVLASGVGGNGDYTAGASGGSIILSDDDQASVYDGLIAAQGGLCRRAGSSGGSGDCHEGGGGGGYISINTKSNANVLLSRYSTDRSKRLWAPDVANVYNPSIETFTGSGGFLQNTISAAGGKNEFVDETGWGAYGIVQIVSSSQPSLTIRKELAPVKRNNLVTSFNPYALQPDDEITVTIRVQDVRNGTKIEDEILRQHGVTGGYYCDPIRASINPSDGTVSDPPNLVSWTAQADVSGESSFSYNCKITK